MVKLISLFPATVVTPSRSIFGERIAIIMATASSEPVSQSRMTFLLSDMMFLLIAGQLSGGRRGKGPAGG